ncbi:hypothetical protein [Roseovarius sp. D0-M9]|uniref:hypothetical protein n=1 Tax=Roseovarius sp. D0-M9 TaxID=3127117 RepID=UPI00300FE918
MRVLPASHIVALSVDDHIMADVIRLQEEISTAEIEIATLEIRINQTIYRLHDLTPVEISLIEATV